MTVQSLYGFKLRQEDDLLRQIHMAQPMVARCALCPETFEGTAQECIDWGSDHRMIHAKPKRRKVLRAERTATEGAPPLSPLSVRSAGHTAPAAGRAQGRQLSRSNPPFKVGSSSTPGGSHRPARTKQFTDEKLLTDLRVAAKRLGRSPGANEFKLSESGRATTSTYTGRFGSWNKALILAGLAPRKTGAPLQQMEAAA